MRYARPLGLTLQVMGRLLVQGLQDVRVLQRQGRQPRREGQGREKGGDNRRDQGRKDAADQAYAPCPATCRIMKDEIGHRPLWSPSGLLCSPN